MAESVSPLRSATVVSPSRLECLPLERDRVEQLPDEVPEPRRAFGAAANERSSRGPS